MNATSIRIVREARILYWPWCAVTFVGIVPWLQRNLVLPPLLTSPGLFLASFAIGMSLLASVPLGSEFEHHALSLLLTQPGGRGRMWGEKISATIVATVAAALAF